MIKFINFVEKPSARNLSYLLESDIELILNVCEALLEQDGEEIFIEDEIYSGRVGINRKKAQQILGSIRYKCDKIIGDCLAKYEENYTKPFAYDEFEFKEDCQQQGCRSLMKDLPDVLRDQIFGYVSEEAFFEHDGIYIENYTDEVRLDPGKYPHISKVVVNDLAHIYDLRDFSNVQTLYINSSIDRTYIPSTYGHNFRYRDILKQMLSFDSIKNITYLFIDDSLELEQKLPQRPRGSVRRYRSGRLREDTARNNIQVVEPEEDYILFDFPHLKNLVFGSGFSANIILNLPELDFLTFGYMFNGLINIANLESLTQLVFGHNFNKPIDNFYLPNLTTLVFGHDFNQPIDNIQTPNLRYIVFGKNFQEPIEYLYSLEHIKVVVFGNHTVPARRDPSRLIEGLDFLRGLEHYSYIDSIETLEQRYPSLFKIVHDNKKENESIEEEARLNEEYNRLDRARRYG
jgi:hypothetical protein